MKKESILYDILGIYSYELKTHTLITEDKKVTTYYQVVWHRKALTEIEQDITKQEYDFLLQELKGEEK